MDMVISNHSPFVKFWFIIQLIAKHLTWWMWIGYVKFNMLHLKISHWIFEESFWLSKIFRSFSASIRWTLRGFFPGCWEGGEGILMLHPTVHCLGGSPPSFSNNLGNKNQLVFSLDQCKEQNHARSFRSLQGFWVCKHNEPLRKTCQQEVQSLWDADEPMSFGSINILSYYRISHVYPIPYTHMSHIFVWVQPNPFFSIQMR